MLNIKSDIEVHASLSESLNQLKGQKSTEAVRLEALAIVNRYLYQLHEENLFRWLTRRLCG